MVQHRQCLALALPELCGTPPPNRAHLALSHPSQEPLRPSFCLLSADPGLWAWAWAWAWPHMAPHLCTCRMGSPFFYAARWAQGRQHGQPLRLSDTQPHRPHPSPLTTNLMLTKRPLRWAQRVPPVFHSSTTTLALLPPLPTYATRQHPQPAPQPETSAVHNGLLTPPSP